MNSRRLVATAVAVLALVAVGTSANARNANPVKLRWSAQAEDSVSGASPYSAVIGFVGCDMHAPRGPQVAMIQVALGRVAFDPGDLLGMPCADALVRLQSTGIRLGASRVIPGIATTDPDCLAWDILGPEVP